MSFTIAEHLITLYPAWLHPVYHVGSLKNMDFGGVPPNDFGFSLGLDRFFETVLLSAVTRDRARPRLSVTYGTSVIS